LVTLPFNYVFMLRCLYYIFTVLFIIILFYITYHILSLIWSLSEDPEIAYPGLGLSHFIDQVFGEDHI